jgi:hypothetical protein
MQIDLDRIVGFDKGKAVAHLNESGADVQVHEGLPDEAYINFNCWTDDDVLPIWQHLQRFFADQPAVREAAIVVCTGRSGWDDYLLLHGAAEGETLDTLEASS